MVHLATDTFAGQRTGQIALLLLAFVLSTLIGLERRLRGSNAGLRTQAIVGTSLALFVLVGKYGFSDMLGDNVSFDPSRIAAGIVSGISFLGARLILTPAIPSSASPRPRACERPPRSVPQPAPDSGCRP